jgi:hypothetical protein
MKEIQKLEGGGEKTEKGLCVGLMRNNEVRP